MSAAEPPPSSGPDQRDAPRQGRSVAFFVAIFLAFLLLISGALNVLLFVASIGSFAASGLEASAEDGGSYRLVHVGGDADAPARVLRIPIQGAISEGQNPLLGASGGTVSRVRRALRVAASDPDIRGVLLAIDSPGGGVTDSDEIYREVRRFRAENPGKRVIASIGDMAASGGYYVALAAERILARRTSVTGSIGVIMSAWNFAEAAKNLGIEQIAIKSEHTPLKDVLSPTRAMTEAERSMLTGIVEELYEQFLDVVSEGRPGLQRERIEKLADGSIYTAKAALSNGLIDEIGDERDALSWFERKLGGSVDLLEHRRLPSLREILFGVSAAAPPMLERTAARLISGTSGPRFLYYWQGGR
ncbi:MAG: signal peptide peptidase SppA [Planctomycetota bacterium]